MITVENNLTMKKLKRIEPGEPKQIGHKWAPTDYPEFVQMLKVAAVETGGFTIDETRVATGGEDDGELIASLVFSNPSGLKGLKPSIGVITGNAGRRRTKFYGGVVSEALGVGMVFTTHDGKKNTSRNDKEEDCIEAMAWFKDEVKGGRLKNLIKDLIESTVSREVADHLICEACRGTQKNRFQWAKIGLVDKALKEGGDEVSQFRLYLAFAQVNATCVPRRQLDQLERFYGLLMNEPAAIEA